MKKDEREGRGGRPWRRVGARTTVLRVSVHARKRHNGTLAICIYYTRTRARARPRLLYVPRGITVTSSAIFLSLSRFSGILPIASLRSSSFLLALSAGSACTRAYFVLGVSHGS